MDDIPTDDKVYTAEEEKLPDIQLAKKVRDQNTYTTWLLLACINDDTDDGLVAWYVVDGFCDASEGYAGGKFKKAWEALSNKYEEMDYMAKSDLLAAYYNLKMTKTDYLETFIM